MEVKIRITEALELIPEFHGERSEMKFIYFREGCKNALTVLGDEHESLLLIFLKTKLKDNAYTRFALKLTTYKKLSQFLEDVRKTYAWRCDNTVFWAMEMMELQQQDRQSIYDYSAEFQQLLQCAIFGIQGSYDQQPGSSLSKENELKKIEELEGVATMHFIKNLSSDHIRASVNAVHKYPKTLMDIVHSALSIEAENRKAIVCTMCDDSDHTESECYMKEGYDYFTKHCDYCDKDGHLELCCPILISRDRQRDGETSTKRKLKLSLMSSRYNKRINQPDSDSKSDQSSSTNGDV